MTIFRPRQSYKNSIINTQFFALYQDLPLSFSVELNFFFLSQLKVSGRHLRWHFIHTSTRVS